MSNIISFCMSILIIILSVSGFSALHYAVDGGHIDAVNYALSEGVDVSYTSTLLHKYLSFH